MGTKEAGIWVEQGGGLPEKCAEIETSLADVKV